MNRTAYRRERRAILAKLDEARESQQGARGIQRAAFGVAVDAARDLLAAIRAEHYHRRPGQVAAARLRALEAMGSLTAHARKTA